jgi:integrase
LLGFHSSLPDVVGTRTIEINAPEYLRNIVRIITEAGWRVYQ